MHADARRAVMVPASVGVRLQPMILQAAHVTMASFAVGGQPLENWPGGPTILGEWLSNHDAFRKPSRLPQFDGGIHFHPHRLIPRTAVQRVRSSARPRCCKPRFLA